MSDADVVDEVLDLLRSEQDWTEASLSTTLEQRGWCFPEVSSSIGDHAGTVVWEGDVLDGSGTTHSIRIDAGTGKVVTETVDTDD